MDKFRERQFIEELHTQISFALISIEKIKHFIGLINSDDGTYSWVNLQPDYFWYYAQNLITVLGNISKILYGVKSKDKRITDTRFKERAEFRKLLNVDDNPIVNNRDLRNALEHIDERLEEFTSHRQFLVLDKNYGSVTQFITLFGKPYDLSKVKNLRHFDNKTITYYFYGESLKLDKAFEFIEELKLKVDKLRPEYQRANY